MKLQIDLEGITYDVNVELAQSDLAPAAGESAQSGAFSPEADPNLATPRKRRRRLGANDNECRSPMCGTIVRVNVEPGQLVEADEVVVVLEAMKMETNLRAPRTCHVKAVNVKMGEGVFTKQVLVEFE